MEKLHLEIQELENGYVVHEVAFGKMERFGRRWVARSEGELATLVSGLAVDAKKDRPNKKCCHED
jgi:hypothetical protein